MSVGSLEWRQQAQQVAECAQKTLPDLIGVYVHGSAAFGDLNASSDLDVLVVTDSQIGCEAFSADVLAQARKPRPLELSVVQTQDAVWARPPWRFLRHVNSAQSRVVSGDSVEDPDLAAHYAVTRAVGVAVAGPPATEVFGEVGRADLLVYLQNDWSGD